ncbi:hypothetical protein RvY_01146 [Ramazzottius varieornatus]|uniref:Uncharacterized protein n=1 Tax=Ramazzottius varieornatus TaxID=947166 RepID=A0A1D1UFA0_RAMVA|nr:hypothetical protein RvY_01146 [Ramazzottius varieornatus]
MISIIDHIPNRVLAETWQVSGTIMLTLRGGTCVSLRDRISSRSGLITAYRNHQSFSQVLSLHREPVEAFDVVTYTCFSRPNDTLKVCQRSPLCFAFCCSVA